MPELRTPEICTGSPGISEEMLRRLQPFLPRHSDSRLERPCTRHLLPHSPAPECPASEAQLPASSICPSAAPEAGSDLTGQTANPAPPVFRWHIARTPRRPLLPARFSISYSS